jgi:hypothetical protein
MLEGNGRPFMNTPPSWLILPCPKKELVKLNDYYQVFEERL